MKQIAKWAAMFIAAVAASAALSVHASTFTITSSTSGSNQAGFVTTFSVSRSGEGTNSFEKVNFRTASLSAYAGQHFTPTNGVLDFVPGETNKSVAVREYAAGADAYRYQRSNFQRSYRFEIDDSQGSFLKSLERARSVGTGINTNSVFAVQDLTITNGTITVTDGGYAQAHHDVSVSSYYSAAAPANYLVAAGATLRMTVTFDAREKDDGYQYIQIYANTTADDSHTDTGAKNGNPGDYNYARYVAGFTIDGNVSSTYYPYTFPLTSTNHNCGAQAHPWSGNSNGNLVQQYFQSNCRADDGRLIIPTSLTSLYIRLNASGDFGDTWYAQNVKAHIQAVDATFPKLYNNSTAGIAVVPGPYYKGGRFYVSVPFNEIVYAAGSPKRLLTTWGAASYEAGDGSNVITFKGTISADPGTQLAITNCACNFRDIANNHFQGSVNKTFSGAVVEIIPWDGYGTAAAPYVIATTNQLNLLAARVNAGESFANTYFTLGTDIAYSRPVSSTWSNPGAVNNYTPIGGVGTGFRGIFDGKGYTVSGIRIYKTGTGNADSRLGLFGSNEGTVRNVVLADTAITGYESCGGIAGYNSGTVENCRVKNNVGISGATSGAIVGSVSGSATLAANYYRGCTVNGVADNVGTSSGDVPGARGLYTLALADGISVVSAETVPITNVTYYAANTPVLIACTPPAGYALLTCALNGTPLTGDTFTMPFADSSVSVSWYPTFNGSGTQDDPYLISSRRDLDALAANVNNGITNYAGAYFLQTADIAYSGNKNNYTPVGTNDNSSFSGIYDGGGRVVSGLVVQRKNYLGLFGSVTNGIVRNVSLVDCSFSGENYAGGIVGLLADGIVSNCCAGSGVFVKDSTSAWCHGGIVGKNDSGTVVGCLSAASVTYNSGWSGVRRRGGVVGLLSRGGSVKDCLYVGDAVEGDANVFGIVELGAIAGVADYGCFLANNYYTSDSVPGGVESHDRNGARRARTLTLGADIALVAGGETVYDVSGLAAIGTNVLRSVSGEGGTNLYSGAEQTISFTYTGTVPPGHVLIVSYNDGADHVLEPANGVYSFVMPDADVTITTTSIIPWSGSGTAADPYLISTTNDLNWLAMFVNDGVNYSGTNFLQTADLPYDGTLNNYTPVGTNGNHSFHGTYDGGGHVVSGIAVDGGTERFLGLFGYVMNGTVRNVVLADCSISGHDNVGGIVGKLIDGVVSNCCVGSGVAVIAGGAGAWWHGGVVGVNHSGTIVGCLSAASVTTNGYGECTCYGGIVGKAVYGSVKDCLYVGDVVEGASYVGAIVGCADDCTLANNYYIRADAPGGVEGNDVPGEAERAYAFIAGPGVTLAAADAVVADYPVSGIAFYDGFLFWDGRFYASEGAGVTLTLGYAVAEGYTLDGGYAVSAGTIAGSTLTVAAMPAAAVTVNANVTVIPWTGSGTEEDPYIILYPSQLDLLATRVNGGTSYLGKYFKLGADIAYDPAALDANGENYTAIGSYSRRFSGNFDGAGHTVSGIRINKTGNDDASDDQGLFGFCDGGTLQNITLADSVIVGKDYVGGIAGKCANCIVRACRAESSVIIKAGCDGADNHGGIVGNMHRLMSGCFSAATVTDNGKANCSYYGGIVGDPWPGTVKDCLAIGSVVTSYSWGGAIAGYVYRATFTNNYYAACAVNGRATNVGCGQPNGDIDGARFAHTVTLGGLAVLAGEETVYSNACLTAIGTNVLRHVVGGTTNLYSGAGQTLTLTGDVDGYAVTKDADGTDVTASVLNGSTITMPDYDITVAAYFLPGWERLQAAIDAAEDGATIVLTRDYVYTSPDNGENGNTRWVGGSGSGSAGSETGSIVYPAGNPLTIPGGKSIMIDLNGHTIDGNGGSSVFHVGGGGALTLTNSIPESGAVTNGYAEYGGGVYVDENGTFTLAGGTICGSSVRNGGGVYVSRHGTFTMTGGAISGNSAESDGGGVFVNEFGAFTLTGGMIVGNTAHWGGGVYPFGTFTMVGGAISGNFARYGGGGVYVNHGFFTLTGGTISGNCADGFENGGGVSVGGGTFVMGGGAISGNYSNGRGGGGVDIDWGGVFTLTGGTISGNCGEYGGGVLVDEGTFMVSGNPVVSGNTNDVEDVSNVYLNENLAIAVSNLTAGAFLGVTTYPEPEEGSPVTITTGAVLGDVQYFFSDDPNCSVGTATNGEVYLVYGVAYPTYLNGADDTVKEYYEAWAAQHGPDTLNAYETEFLLGVAPGAVTNGAAPLKIVEIGTTNILMSESGDFGLIATMMGYSGEYLPCRRIVLASDVTELWQSEWGDARELCNGYLVLRITDDLSLPKSAWQAISWFAQLEDGRAVILYPEIFKEPVCRYFENLSGKPVNGLFLSVCIETAPIENTFFINELIPMQ